MPYLKRLSAEILSRECSCLSIDSTGTQWLSFEDSSKSPLHVPPPTEIPSDLRGQFPFSKIPGLEQFLESFSGLADWNLPPCPWFIPTYESRVVSSDCDLYDWGRIGEWTGSLPLYNTGTGNFIVVSPDNVCAKWEHDIGWSGCDENPFWSLDWNMSELVEQFVTYLSQEEVEAKDSPFYY